ncbi:hypothetical protein B484DRAFT_403149 [Ochromonadaceae sp. CCMP2298]|nr:hypothetical protein B484DRAFT_403149 [Ochromonadaceae sp. CCMP2298]
MLNRVDDSDVRKRRRTSGRREREEQEEEEEEEGLDVTEMMFEFNKQFDCPQREICLPNLVISDPNTTTTNDRDILIEAAIVKIMKASLTLSHKHRCARGCQDLISQN